MLTKQQVYSMYRLCENEEPADCRKEPLWAAVSNRFYPPELFEIAKKYPGMYSYIVRDQWASDTIMYIPIRVIPYRRLVSKKMIGINVPFKILDNVHQAYAGQHPKGLAQCGGGDGYSYKVEPGQIITIYFHPNVSRILFTNYKECCTYCYNKFKRPTFGYKYHSFFLNRNHQEEIAYALNKIVTIYNSTPEIRDDPLQRFSQNF